MNDTSPGLIGWVVAPTHLAPFVCTSGATAYMNGTALFEGVTVLFLAPFFGIELNLLQQVTILVLCILGGIGAAGVSGGSQRVIGQGEPEHFAEAA